jgi:Zn-dependent protease
MALLWAIIVKVSVSLSGNYFALPLALMGAAGIFINVIFMVLNLLPLPPLDGGRMLVSVLPRRLAYKLSRTEPYGFVILLVLLFTGVLGYVLWPAISLAMAGISGVFGIPLAELIRLGRQ